MSEKIQEEINLKIPFFFFNDPVARRGALDFNRIVWITYFGILFFIGLYIVFGVLENKANLMATLFPFISIASFGFAIAFFLSFILSHIFYEKVSVRNFKLIIHGTFLNNYKNREYELKNINYILWLYKRNRHSLYLVTKDSNKIILIKEFGLMGGLNKWSSFVENLSKITNLSINYKEKDEDRGRVGM